MRVGRRPLAAANRDPRVFEAPDECRLDRRIPLAVEEFLRFLSPLAHIGRTVATDGELGGHGFREGELVSLCFLQSLASCVIDLRR